jgi:hypothetical protein
MAAVPRNLVDLMSLASRALGGEASSQLPLCDPETVITLQDAYEEAFNSGKETDEARFRLVSCMQPRHVQERVLDASLGKLFGLPPPATGVGPSALP